MTQIECRVNGPATGPLVAGEGDPTAADDKGSVQWRPRGPHTIWHSFRGLKGSVKSRGQAGRGGKRLCGPSQLEKE